MSFAVVAASAAVRFLFCVKAKNRVTDSSLAVV